MILHFSGGANIFKVIHSSFSILAFQLEFLAKLPFLAFTFNIFLLPKILHPLNLFKHPPSFLNLMETLVNALSQADRRTFNSITSPE